MHPFHRKPVLRLAAAAALLLLSACGTDGSPASAPMPGASNQPTPTITASASPKAVKESFSSIQFGQKEIVLAPGGEGKPALYGITAQGKIDLAGREGITFVSSKPDLATVSGTGSLRIQPKAPTGSTLTVTAEYRGSKTELTVRIKYSLEDTVRTVSGKPTVTNIEDLAVVVNKKRSLPETYAPTDLTEPNVPFSFNEKNEKRKLRKDAAKALEQLFELAKKDGIKLYAISGYRSFATQKAIYANNVRTQGEKEASRFSAQAGQSEHQTGLAMDVSSASAKFALEESFGATAEGKWLAANAHKAGFIIRYPKGKEAITGYSYEPWHIRYVGMEIAKDVVDQGITLEEYFQDAVPVNR